MKLKTLIIDDEAPALEKLRSYVERVPYLELVAECLSGLDAIDYISTNAVDLIFTDIDMPDINGMELAQTLVSRPMVVFITAYSQYAAESYRLGVVDYLLKPYSFTDFQKSANKALATYKWRHPETSVASSEPAVTPRHFFFKLDSRYVRVNLDEILYIKGSAEYLQIYIDKESSPLMPLASFAAIMEKLSDDFLQVHRSYIVNMARVHLAERSKVTLDSGDVIPVSDSYKASLQEYLRQHALGGRK